MLRSSLDDGDAKEQVPSRTAWAIVQTPLRCEASRPFDFTYHGHKPAALVHISPVPFHDPEDDTMRIANILVSLEGRSSRPRPTHCDPRRTSNYASSNANTRLRQCEVPPLAGP